ncbi:MAG: hypothetical protein PHR28_12135 [candidate division Zixibacteria bacterium]|jgi:hypothetical protein|nr:hypothetical protein [candidate division Zixibacteria bacterium]
MTQPLQSIVFDGKTFYIFDTYSSEANAAMCADIARRSRLFNEVQVVPQNSPLNSRFLLCVHGVNDAQMGKTAEDHVKELELPKRMPFDELETASRFRIRKD